MPPRTFGPPSTTRYTVSGVAFDTIRVPPGRFVDGEGLGKRTLLVSRPFELGVTLVTQALWRAVMGTSPSRFAGDDRPVEQVSWDNAQVFLGRLEVLGFRGFRLPTEAEWAWAARCGVSTRWAGADRVKSVAVVDQPYAAPVGSLLPSVAGVLDLSGNVWEWQQGWWSDLPTGSVDTEGPASGSGRANRGSSWISVPQVAGVAIRNSIDPGHRSHNLGLRLLRTAP
jgi:formylglycine-generating enzyme required for sulfatase activity